MKKKTARFSAAFLAVILVFNLYAQPKAKAIGAEAIAVGIVASAAAIYFVASGLSTEATGMTPESFKKAMEESIIGEFCESINTTIVQLATPFLENVEIDPRRPGIITFGTAIAGTLFDLIQFAIQKFQLNSTGDTATVATNEYVEMLNGEKLYIGSNGQTYQSKTGQFQLRGFEEKPTNAIDISKLFEKVNNWDDEVWNNAPEYEHKQQYSDTTTAASEWTRENVDGILWETTIGTNIYTLGYKYIKTIKYVYQDTDVQYNHIARIVLIDNSDTNKNKYIDPYKLYPTYYLQKYYMGETLYRTEYGIQKEIKDNLEENTYIFPMKWTQDNRYNEIITFGIPYYTTNSIAEGIKYLLTGQLTTNTIMQQITGIALSTGIQQNTIQDESLSFTREEGFSITQPQEGQQIAIDTGMDFGDEDDTQTILDGALGAILAGTADFTATTETQATETDWDEAPTVDEAYEVDPGDQPGGDIEPGDLIGLLSGGAFASIWHYVLELLAYGADGIDAIKAVFDGLPYAVKLPYYASLAVMLIFGILLRILI